VTKVLLVWFDNPERERIFLLDFDSEMAYRRCLTCHGHFLNAVNDETIDECLQELNELVEHIKANEVLFDSYQENNLVKSVDKACAIVVSGCLI
jgi:hypothetical protein